MSEYRSPATVIAACREKGNRTAGELYACAIGRVPRQLNDRSVAIWTREARRLAESQGTLEGAGGRRRAKKRSRKARKG